MGKFNRAAEKGLKGLLNNARALLRDDAGIDHYPITENLLLKKSHSLAQLTNWAMKYHNLEDLEKGIAVVRKAKKEKTGQAKAREKKYDTLGLVP